MHNDVVERPGRTALGQVGWPASGEPRPDGQAPALSVRIDQDLCTGDGLCVEYSPDVFEFDIDGLAYVKDAEGNLQTAAGANVAVPAPCIRDVLDAADGCPGNCIHVLDADGIPVAGPEV